MLADIHAEKRSYTDMLVEAFTTSKEVFAFPSPPAIDPTWKISDQDIAKLDYFINHDWALKMGAQMDPYWGDQCQFLAGHIVSYLNMIHNIPAEIIIGEVSINGTLEYDANFEELKQEYFSETRMRGNQNLHAWVSIGGDVIIDAAIGHRLAKNYNVPLKKLPRVMVRRASGFIKSGLNFSAKHLPMIYGSDFLEKTTLNGPSTVKFLYEMARSS
ncbi:hypothetical protein [Aquitalea sp. ASV11]|uniref:hypothetical protein n=1 Tax=Aquitalea sp. ASV11 TaxID=2795103 RepID=UPI0018EE2259|nr:hypothetical protein [Aquitalea sp. ASV11]